MKARVSSFSPHPSSLPMILIPSKHFIKHPQPTRTPVAVLPFTLVSASYQQQTAVRLTFNRAIDPSDVLPDGFNVFDADAQQQFIGNSYSMPNPTTIVIELIIIGDYLGGGISLIADASNGIKAAGDGAVWDGVSGLGLPFP